MSDPVLHFGLDPALVFGFGLRGLALVQLLSFYSLYRDVLGIAGSRGLQPVAEVLGAYRRDFGWRRFLYAPSLLHLSCSDRALRGWIVLGALASVVAFVGGPLSPLAFAVAWAVTLSYDVAVDLHYPWDAMVLEAGLLAALGPALAWLPDVAASVAPHPMLAWAFRFLAFRVVLGFGKYKFLGPGTLDTGYLKSFLVTQPMPRPLGLVLQRLPIALHRIALAALFLIEVVSPWLWLSSPSLRWIPTLAVTLLMLGIQLTGNFGFFNLATIVVAILAATPSASAFDLAFDRPSLAADLPHVMGAALLVLGLAQLPFNSWVARSWMYWPDLARLGRGIAQGPLALMRFLAPFHLIHAYGVFGPECGPRGQWVPVVEGTLDGIIWQPYRYLYYPSDAEFRGVRVAPLFPRFDHALIYEAMGMGLGNLMGSIVGGGNPYRATRALFLQRVQTRLLEGSPEVMSLFGAVPFGGATPRAVRVRFRFHQLDEGAPRVRFVVHELGLHLPARTLEERVPIEMPLPEAFLPDERIWTMRARGLGDSTEGIEQLQAEPLFPWRTPSSTMSSALRWGETHAQSVRAVEPSLLRAAWLLRARSQPMPGEGELELWLRSIQLASRGREAVRLALVGSPSRALAAESVEEGWRVFAVLRPDWVRFHARKARLRKAMLRGASAKPPSFAPGILRHLGHLAALDDDRSPLPHFERERGGEYAVLEAHESDVGV